LKDLAADTIYHEALKRGLEDVEAAALHHGNSFPPSVTEVGKDTLPTTKGPLFAQCNKPTFCLAGLACLSESVSNAKCPDIDGMC
jgi:hypothetical protein